MAQDELELARTQLAVDPTGTAPTVAGDERRPTPAAASAMQSARIGRYAVLRPLGEGGMGVVYAAYDEELDRKVAIKLVHHERSGGTEGRARILREAQALARLSHPNVVQIHEVGEHERQIYVVMEHIQGVTLGAWLRAGERPLPAILDAFRQAGEGLDAAHQAGLVHRDFKPENVLFGDDGRVRVVDFGLAQVRGRVDLDPSASISNASASTSNASASTSMTATGAVMGTPAYMSPEQLAAAPIDARTDVFSLSVALWEAIHGERPFAGDTLPALTASVVAGERRAPRIDLPLRLSRALERGLAIDPEARWPTLRPLLDALAVDLRADPTAAPRERRRFVGALSVMFALLFVSAVYVIVHVGEAAFYQWMIILGSAVAAILITLAFLFRRSLLRNTYHRRMILYFVCLAVVTASHRLISAAHGMPLIDILLSGLHILTAMALVAALTFARWFAIVAAVSVTAIVLAVVAPQLFPAALLVMLPLYAATFAYFWRRDLQPGRRPGE